MLISDLNSAIPTVPNNYAYSYYCSMSTQSCQMRYISVPGQRFWEGSHSLKVWPGRINRYHIHLTVASIKLIGFRILTDNGSNNSPTDQMGILSQLAFT